MSREPDRIVRLGQNAKLERSKRILELEVFSKSLFRSMGWFSEKSWFGEINALEIRRPLVPRMLQQTTNTRPPESPPEPFDPSNNEGHVAHNPCRGAVQSKIGYAMCTWYIQPSATLSFPKNAAGPAPQEPPKSPSTLPNNELHSFSGPSQRASQ